jgi:spore coat polysaccharide biosynthesis protein SpsF
MAGGRVLRVHHPVVAFVQARMSSRRFPGKVLAPFRGQPIIRHVIGSVTGAVESIPLVVATSIDASDDPLTAYVEGLGVPVFRGALADVFRRFRDCLDVFPCDWILRIPVTVPLLDPRIVKAVVARGVGPEARVDLVTTIFPRTFPTGQNAELIRSDAFRAIDMDALTDRRSRARHALLLPAPRALCHRQPVVRFAEPRSAEFRCRQPQRISTVSRRPLTPT